MASTGQNIPHTPAYLHHLHHLIQLRAPADCILPDYPTMDNLSKIPTPGEVIHDEIDAEKVLAVIAALPTLDEKIRYAARVVPGGATIASMTAPTGDAIAEEFRQLNSTLLRRNDKATGASHGIGYQSLSNYGSILEAILAMSGTLTAADLRQAEAVSVNGGARCYMLIQVYLDQEERFKELHLATILDPKEKADGEKWFMDPRYNLWRYKGAHVEYLNRAYGRLNLRIKSAEDPKNEFEKLHAAAPPDHRLGMHGMVFAAPFSDGDGRLLTVEVAREALEYCNDLNFDTRGVIEFDIPKDAYQRWVAARHLIDEAHENGEVASFGNLTGGSNCVIMPHRLQNDDTSSVPANTPLHTMLAALADTPHFRNGNGSIRWTDQRRWDAKHFFEDSTRFPKIDKSELDRKLENLVQQGSAGKFLTQFCRANEEHPDGKVREVYHVMRKLALEKLRQMAAKDADPAGTPA